MSQRTSPRTASVRVELGSCSGRAIVCGLTHAITTVLTPKVAQCAPRIIELQIKTEKLVTLVRQRLAEETPCDLDD